MEQIDKNYEHICPLCKGNKISNLETFQSSSLTKFYQQNHHFDISYLLKSINIIKIKKCNKCSLIYFYPNVTGDEKFYAKLQQSPNYYYEDKWEYQIAKKYFSNKLNVLEIGAGEGAFSRIISYKTYTGLELSDNAVQLAKQKGITLFNKKVQVFAAENSCKKFDVIVSFQVLEHVALNELHSFIDTSLQLLKTGGKLIICVPADSSFVGSTPNMTFNMPPHHVSRWPDETFTKMEQIFAIKKISVYHEPLKQVNYNPFITSKLFKILGIHRKIVRDKTGFAEKILNRIIKYVPFIFKEKIIKGLNARGHSIIVVYKKV